MPRSTRFRSPRRSPRSSATRAKSCPAFNAYLYFRIGYWIGRKVAQGLYRVRLGFVDTEALKKVPENATVVFVMNHRSNMDYILAGYLAADQAALSYAVGEWARIWPLSALIRSMGAYFVRRNSKDELYRRVLERYIVMATQAGVPQAVFPEGGLTRDGLMREPRLGVVDYMLRGFWLDGARDLVFVPLGLNYDRVLEDRTLLLVDRPERAQAEPLLGRLEHARLRRQQPAPDAEERLAPLRLRLRQLRRAGVDARVLHAARAGFPEAVGRAAQARDRRPRHAPDGARRQHRARGAGAADCLGSARNGLKPISELELKSAVEQLIEKLEAAGAHVYIPRKDLDYAVTVGLRMLTLRRLVEEKDGLYAPRAGRTAADPLLRQLDRPPFAIAFGDTVSTRLAPGFRLARGNR